MKKYLVLAMAVLLIASLAFAADAVKNTGDKDLEGVPQRTIQPDFHHSAGYQQGAATTNFITEGFENGGAIPTGWSDSPGTDPWLYDAGADHGPGSANSGSYAAYFNIYDYTSGTVDSLISPGVDLSTGTGFNAVSFWGWHNSGSDSLVVYLSESGTLTRLDVMPNSSSWTQYTYNFYSSDTNAKIYFIGYSNYGLYNLYIDDVTLDDQALPTGDVAVTSIDSPAEVLLLAGTYTLTATVENLDTGDATLDSLVFSVVDDGGSGSEVFRNVRTGDVITGSSSAQFSSTSDWTVATPDFYAITVSAFLTGDANPGDNALTTTRVIQPLLSYPFDEDFEGGLVTSIWDWVGFGTGFGYTTLNYHSPDTAMWFSYSGYPNERIAVSPPIVVSGSTDPLFRFWEKSSGSSGPAGDETHVVAFAPGGTWNGLAVLDTIFFDDSSSTMTNVYRESIASAGTIEGDTVRVVLWYHNTTSAAWNWYVDDLSLANTPVGDVGPTNFVSGTVGIANQVYTPVVEVTNYGFDTPDVPVKLIIDSLGTPVYTEFDTITAIPSNGTANATFAGFTPLTTDPGTYTMTATTELVTVLLDNDPTNDTLTAALTVVDNQLDFESSDGGLVGSGDWQWGAPTSGPGSAYSGSNVWATNLGGNYTNTFSELSFYISVGTTSPTFGFASWYDTELRYDGGNFAVSTDNGATWDVISPDIGYVDTSYTPPIEGDSVFTGHNQGFWEGVSFDLSAYAGSTVKARLAFMADGSVFYPGWYVDDFSFLDCDIFFPADDIAATSIDDPSGFLFTGSTIDPKGTVTNVGTDAQTFDAIMTIEDTATVIASVVYADTVQVTSLAGGASQQVTFASWMVPSGDGETYTFTLSVDNPGDFDTGNDMVTGDYDAYTHYSEGGPDDYGYRYYDNYSSDPLAPTFSWIDLTTSPTADTAGTGSGNLGKFEIGFDFNFYGTTFDSVFINGYGYLQFGDTYTSTGLNDCPLPSSTTPYQHMIAAFWDYGYPSGTYDGATIYETFGTAPNRYMVVEYHNHKYSTYYDDIDFEIIIHENGDIVYQYLNVAEEASNYGVGQSATVGIESDTSGTRSGFTYLCNDDPTGNRLQDNLAILWHYEVPSLDAALSSVDEPAGVLFNGTTVTPTVTVANNGTNATAVDVTFQIYDSTPTLVYDQTETTASIPGGGSVQHAFATTWNATPDGDYDVVAFVELTGDSNPANDTANTSFEVATHYSQGGPDGFGYRFIDNQGGGVVLEDPPVFNWIDLTTSPTADTAGTSSGNLGKFPVGFDFNYYGATFDSVFINGYGYLQFGDSFTSTGLNDCPLPSTTSPYQHMIAAFWDYGYPSGTYDGATIYETFGTAPDRYMVVEYHNHKYSTYYANNDFEIILHENGNIVFQYLNVAEEATNYGVGQSATVGLESDTSGTRYGMTYLCNDDPIGNELVDSLAIKWYVPVFAHDVVVQQFNVPGSAGLVNVAFTPEVVFYNNGTSDETNVPVRLLIEPGGYDDAQSIATLDSGTAVAQQFSSFTPTSTGPYTLTAINELVGDEDPLFDTLVIQFTAFDEIYDFEANNGGLIGSGDWQWGAPTSGPGSAYSGANVWATILDGNYSTSTLSTLEFDLAVGSTSPSMGVASWYDTENRFDGGNFGISTDDGATWITVSPDIGYDDSTYSSNPLDPDSIFTGHNQQYWDVINFDLSAFAGMTVKARFAFGADGSVVYPGWYLDDMGLTDCAIAAPDIAVTPTSVAGEADQGGTDYDTLTVSNTGDANLTYSVAVTQDPMFTSFDGSVQQLYAVGNGSSRIAQAPIGYHPVSDKLTAGKNPDEIANLQGAPIYPPQILSFGGPDTFGYTWIDSDEPDGPTYNWIDISGVGTEITSWTGSVDDGYFRTEMGMTFNYYGAAVDSATISTNGWVSFDAQTNSYYSNDSIPDNGNPNNVLAVLWGDQDGGTVGHCYYYYDATENQFIVSWVGWPWYPDPEDPHDFEMILDADDGTILYQYGPGVYHDDATVGIENGDGTDGLLVSYNATYAQPSLAVLFVPPIQWLSTDVSSGTIVPGGGPDEIEVMMDATELPAGVYTGNVVITSNDPDESEISVPVTFTVNSTGCTYVTGDVNGSDSYNGLDITYGVAFFKGGPDPMCPIGSCPVPPCNEFFYCGDVNGSCSYNGLDITYGVSYFKGGPGPVPCPSCPPVGGPATIGNQLTPSVEPAKIEKSKSKTEQLNSAKKGNSLNK